MKLSTGLSCKTSGFTVQLGTILLSASSVSLSSRALCCGYSGRVPRPQNLTVKHQNRPSLKKSEYGPMKEQWLRLDELENAIDNLEMAGYFLQNVPSAKKWKWAIIAIHQALYGFAICSIQGTDAQSVIAGTAELPEGKLISIREALKRTKDPEWMPRSDCMPLVTSTDEDTALERVIGEFRNEFEHFRPKHWSIEVSGMPKIVGHVLRVIRFLALESRCVTYADEDQMTRVGKALAIIEQRIKQEAAA